MNYGWCQHEAARKELRKAANFIEDEREGWRDRFIEEVDAAIASIIESRNSLEWASPS